MGLIQEFRSSLENPQTPLSYPQEWLLDIFNGGRTDSGIRVSEMTALQVSTVYACIEIKAGVIGFLDLPILERTLDGKNRAAHRVAYEHSLYELLEHQPNPEMTSFTLRKTVQAHRMLWGNGYIELQRDRSGNVVALWPRNPSLIKPKRATGIITTTTLDGITVTVNPGDLIYVTTEGIETESVDPENPSPRGQGADRVILPCDLLHMPGLALDGRLGQSVVWLARQAVGMALATEKFGGKFFANGAVGYGVFEYPSAMDDIQRTQFSKSIQEAFGGENQQRPLVLEGGIKYTPTSTKPNEAQFKETRDYQVTEICRFYGIPPHMVGMIEKTSRANTEQIGQELLTFGLNPDLKIWQQELRRKLFPKPSLGRNAGRTFFARFDTSPLTMPDADSRRNYVASNIQWGVFSQNDGRAFYGLDPIDDSAADAHWVQVNMQPIDIAYELGSQATESGKEGTNQSDPADSKAGANKDARRKNELFVQRLAQCYSRLFRDAFGRICARSNPDLPAFRRAFMPVFLSLGEEIENLAAAEMNADPNLEALEQSRFLADYFATMQERSKTEGWSNANGHTNEICGRELGRAIRAISVEVYRNAGTRAAKKKTEVPLEVEP